LALSQFTILGAMLITSVPVFVPSSAAYLDDTCVGNTCVSSVQWQTNAASFTVVQTYVADGESYSFSDCDTCRKCVGAVTLLDTNSGCAYYAYDGGRGPNLPPPTSPPSTRFPVPHGTQVSLRMTDSCDSDSSPFWHFYRDCGGGEVWDGFASMLCLCEQ